MTGIIRPARCTASPNSPPAASAWLRPPWPWVVFGWYKVLHAAHTAWAGFPRKARAGAGGPDQVCVDATSLVPVKGHPVTQAPPPLNQHHNCLAAPPRRPQLYAEPGGGGWNAQGGRPRKGDVRCVYGDGGILICDILRHWITLLAHAYQYLTILLNKMEISPFL